MVYLCSGLEKVAWVKGRFRSWKIHGWKWTQPLNRKSIFWLIRSKQAMKIPTHLMWVILFREISGPATDPTISFFCWFYIRRAPQSEFTWNDCLERIDGASKQVCRARSRGSGWFQKDCILTSKPVGFGNGIFVREPRNLHLSPLYMW